MKKLLMLMSAIILLVSFSCNLNTGSRSLTATSKLALTNEDKTSSERVVDEGASSTNIDRIYFRSSDIEFWSITNVEDIDDIYSSNLNMMELREKEGSINSRFGSLAYDLGDEMESIAFALDGSAVTIFSEGSNPAWSDDVEKFINDGNVELNLIRLDVGNGKIGLMIDGENQILRPIAQYDSTQLEANSIIFISTKFLSSTLYVTGETEEAISKGSVSSADLGITDGEFDVVSRIHKSGYWFDEDTPIDVDGVLYIPFEPLNIQFFNPEEEHLVINLNWDIDDAVYYDEKNDQYVIQSKSGTTPFDFEVSLSLEDGPSVNN
jgi:hypothetical protein